jgi:hypothetical protein
VGMAAALTAAFTGHWGRSRFAGRFGTDLPGALIEDGVVQSLAWLACVGGAPKPSARSRGMAQVMHDEPGPLNRRSGAP